MLSTDEKRFVRYWEDQRKGGRRAYLFLYTLIGAFIISMFSFVTLYFFLQIRVSYFLLWIVPSLSLLAALLFAAIVWTRNENRLRNLIHREVEKGKEQEKQHHA